MDDREKAKGLVLEIVQHAAPDADLSDLKNGKGHDVRLRDQLDLDSMDFLDIVMELRKRYKIEVPKEEYLNLTTLDSCADYLEPKLAEGGYLN